MDLAFQLLIFSHARMNVTMFVLTGIMAYFIDYRSLRDEPQFRREATLVRITAFVFCIGGLAVLVAFQILVWLS
ncbi:hypothetical protein [Alicyclobacillus dauci]|uniref:DUF1146 domain-containing protein n=1 Tax=Alicyclobacillus dauci TaxID=1475485 RepID=A0ABY6Z769_9BACL|nr:hypothetical protein [Alicyclobacillus dauci]WAH38731.1 hypothetical protein NZD86_09755 [Alicyclobacillus dauci]